MGSHETRCVMPNRRLSPAELEIANAILADVRHRLNANAGGDPDLLFALRRKVAKELVYDERSKPVDRRRLKRQKRIEQNGLCAVCQQPLQDRYIVLDRIEAVLGYTTANTRLLCEPCDRDVQIARGYT